MRRIFGLQHLMGILKCRRQQPLGILQKVPGPAAPPEYRWSANSSCGQLTADLLSRERGIS